MAEQLRYLVPNESDGATALKTDQDALAAVVENEKLADDLGVKYLVDVYLRYTTSATADSGWDDLELGHMKLSFYRKNGSSSSSDSEVKFELTDGATVIDGDVLAALGDVTSVPSGSGNVIFGGAYGGLTPRLNGAGCLHTSLTTPGGTSLPTGYVRCSIRVPRSEMTKWFRSLSSLDLSDASVGGAAALKSVVPAKGELVLEAEPGTDRIVPAVHVPVAVRRCGLYSCLRPGTPVRMADGSERRIEDVRAGDLVLSVDPETGELVPDRVVAAPRGVGRAWDEWTFSDGTVVGTVGRHRFWNNDLGEFMYLEAWNEGEQALSFADASDRSGPLLVSRVNHDEESEHHTLFTEKYNNYFAAGLLAGNRKSARGRWL